MTETLERLRAALASKYTLEGELGSGGMATVYMAEDIKHRRKVAVKVLRPELAAVIGAERFLKEIEVTANLQHPHILPLHDSGEADSFLYYVMPFVEGETLRDKLNREKQLGVEEAVELSKSVASALDYAHRHGVIHRDIKPENILLHDGQALVADFGISLAVSQAGTGARMTETGLSLGTPHYMSPEQATGDRTLDARSDVYSLGCVTYEMLTGDPPHTGRTVQAIVAKVLSEEPSPITRTRNMVPPNVVAAIQRALMKTPADRFATAAEYAAALVNPAFRLPSADGVAAADTSPRTLWNPVSIGATALATVLLATTIIGWFGNGESAGGLSQQRIVLWKPAPDPFFVSGSAISPDGSTIVYPDTVGGQKLWMKTRDQPDPKPISGTDGALNAFFAPDGTWIGFTALGAKLKKIPVTGGAATTLADSANTGYPAGAWLDDGTILFNRTGFALMRVPGEGGTATKQTDIPSGLGVVAIQPLPGARGALVSLCTTGCGQVAVYVTAFADSAKRLMEDATNAWYLPSGHLLHARVDGAVLAAPFDLKRLEVTGAAIPVLEGVRIAFGQADMAVSTKSGTTLYSTGTADGSEDFWRPVWVDKSGRSTPVDTAWRITPGANGGFALSPDGQRLAINILKDGKSDVWIKRLDQGPLSRLTDEGERNFRPRWTPDGRSVTYMSNRGDDPSYDLYSQRADGSAAAVKILNLEQRITEAYYSPDTAWLVLRLGGLGGVAGGRDVVGIRPGKDTVPVPLISDPKHDAKVVALSPDGKWIAYESTESGRDEIYVRPFPNVSDAKVQVSTNGGLSPVWSRKGSVLYFLNGARELVSAEFTVSGGAFRTGASTVLFSTANRLYWAENTRSFDMHPDGNRFLFLSRSESNGSETTRADDLILVENWYVDINARIAAAKR